MPTLKKLEEAQAQREKVLHEVVVALRMMQTSHAELDRDFRESHAELRESAKRLLDAQARADERLAELTFAQRKTEQAVAELAASNKELAASHKELAASHKELANGQTLMQKALSDLTQAQRSTDERLQELARAMRSEFGEIYKMMGETVEEIARYVVPHYLEHKEGILVGKLEVQFFTLGQRHFEVDLAGDGRRGDEEILVLCEAKRTVDARDVERFHETAKDVAEATGKKVFPVMFGPRSPWRAQARAPELGMLLVPWNYYMSYGRSV